MAGARARHGARREHRKGERQGVNHRALAAVVFARKSARGVALVRLMINEGGRKGKG